MTGNPSRTVTGEPLCDEALQMLEYIRSRPAALGPAGLCERVRAATQELEKAVADVNRTESRERPFAGKWTIAEVVDHIAQTQSRSAAELRHLLSGRRPPGPPVYEALRSGAAAWAPWEELVEGLRSANRDLVAVLESASADGGGPVQASNESEAARPTVRTILVANRTLPDEATKAQIFVAELNWMEYALLQRSHLLDHRTQIKKLKQALASR